MGSGHDEFFDHTGQDQVARCAVAPASLCALAEGTPDHKQLIFTVFDPVKGRGAELLRIDTDPGATYSWALSPDGMQLAVLNPDEGRIRILHLDGRPKEEIAPKNFTFGDGLEWAADGKGLFVDNPTAKGTALSYLDLHGNTRVVWEETTSVGARGIETPWGIPSRAEKRLARHFQTRCHHAMRSGWSQFGDFIVTAGGPIASRKAGL